MEKKLHLRSPKNLTEEQINEAFNYHSKASNFELGHVFREGQRLMDSKYFHKSVLQFITQNVTPQMVYSLMMSCIQMGFDLHATYGDSGPARVYASDEQGIQIREQQERNTAAAGTAKSFPSEITDKVVSISTKEN